MKPTSKLHKHVFGESLWVRLSDAEAIEDELEEWKRVAGMLYDLKRAYADLENEKNVVLVNNARLAYEKLASK